MSHTLRHFLMAIVASSMLLGFLPEESRADRRDRDDYWRGYWRWYDGSYRPYYHRRYRSHHDYHPGYRRDYAPGVSEYRYPHYRGHHRYYHPHGGYQVGPFRFEYWH